VETPTEVVVEATASTATAQADPDTQRAIRQRLEAEKTALLETLAIRKLEEEIRVLREQATAAPATASGTGGGPEAAAATNKRQRPQDTADDDDAPSAKRSGAGGDIRPVKPNPYEGKSLSSLKEYVRRCELAFRIQADRYTQDSARVLYAAQFLTGEPAKAFERLENTNGQDNTSWEEYKIFLRDLIQDPVTRAATLARRYDEAHQRPGQTVTQFVNYLDELENELPPYTDAQRRQHLLAKLLPDLRQALNNYQNVPETRVGLIGLAMQLEANLPRKAKGEGKSSDAQTGHQRDTQRRGKGKAPESPKKDKESKSTQSSTRRANPRPPRVNLSSEERERRSNEKLCYTCGKAGHFANKCTKRPATSATTKEAGNSKS